MQADDIFKKTVYSELVQEMQQKDKDGAFGNPVLPAWYANHSEPTTHQGVGKGLTVVLDAHTDQVGTGGGGGGGDARIVETQHYLPPDETFKLLPT